MLVDLCGVGVFDWCSLYYIPLKVVLLGSASSVVASLAAVSKSSLPGMSACPETHWMVDVSNALI